MAVALSCDGAIWCLGVFHHPDKTKEEKMRITKGSIVAFLDAFLPKLQAAVRPTAQPFRFVALTGMVVVRDQQASVWIAPGLRKEFVSLNLP